jgi:nucleotide-binding universal stress UspA family protein
VRHLRKLEGLAGPLRAAGLSVTTSADWNADLATGIGRHAVRKQPDLIVKDTHHHIPMSRLARSQTDATLIRQLPGALLLVHPTPWPDVPRIAAAIDPTQSAEQTSEIDEALVDVASSVSNVLAGTLDVVRVLRNEAHLPDERATEVQRDRSHMQSRTRVSDVIEHQDPAAVVHFPDGPIAQSLLGFIAQNRPDILVMGVAAQPHWINAFPAGTAAQLLEHLNSDLLVIKQRGFVSTLLTTE